MWRPFAGQFVNHTYESFVQKHKSVRRELPPTPPAQPVQDSEDRGEMLRLLQQKVERQRLLIKQRDFLTQQRQEARRNSLRAQLAKKALRKKRFYSRIRSMATHTVRRSSTPAHSRQGPGIFDLTTAVTSFRLPGLKQ